MISYKTVFCFCFDLLNFWINFQCVIPYKYYTNKYAPLAFSSIKFIKYKIVKRMSVAFLNECSNDERLNLIYIIGLGWFFFKLYIYFVVYLHWIIFCLKQRNDFRPNEFFIKKQTNYVRTFSIYPFVVAFLKHLYSTEFGTSRHYVHQRHGS